MSKLPFALFTAIVLIAPSQTASALDCPELSSNSPTCNGAACVQKRTYVPGDCFLGIPFLCSDGEWLTHLDQFECANSCTNDNNCPAGESCNDGLCEQDASAPPPPPPPPRQNWFCRTFGFFCS